MITLRLVARFPLTLWFLAWLGWELLKANALVTFEVLTPRHYMRPGIIGVPIRSTRDIEITWLANVISLIPGTLSLEVSDDRATLYVHALHISTPDDLRAYVHRLENRILRLLR